MWQRLMDLFRTQKKSNVAREIVGPYSPAGDRYAINNLNRSEYEFAIRILEDARDQLKKPDGETPEGHRISSDHLSYVMPPREDVCYPVVFDFVIRGAKKYGLEPVIFTREDRSVFRKLESSDDMVS